MQHSLLKLRLFIYIVLLLRLFLPIYLLSHVIYSTFHTTFIDNFRKYELSLTKVQV